MLIKNDCYITITVDHGSTSTIVHELYAFSKLTCLKNTIANFMRKFYLGPISIRICEESSSLDKKLCSPNLSSWKDVLNIHLSFSFSSFVISAKMTINL